MNYIAEKTLADSTRKARKVFRTGWLFGSQIILRPLISLENAQLWDLERPHFSFCIFYQPIACT
jgi:hypothetical protein